MLQDRKSADYDTQLVNRDFILKKGIDAGVVKV
jgi:hypothetical protein